MKLPKNNAPAQARFNGMRIDANQWDKFQRLAQRQGWSSAGALRALVEAYAERPFKLSSERTPAGEARTGWFLVDAETMAVFEQAVDKAGISMSEGVRQLVARALSA